jgi:hypothetical protein
MRLAARKIGTAAASTMLAFLLLEAALRVHAHLTDTGRLEDAWARPELPPRNKQVDLGEIIRPSPDPRIIYELKPGLDVWYQGARLETNGAGWREEELPAAKPAGTVRILGLGDSHMFGWGLPVGERGMDRLEDLLASRRPGVRFRSVVLAAPGYNLAMQLGALERYGLGYEPDLVIHHAVGNDHCLPSFVYPRTSPWSLESFTIAYLRRALGPPPVAGKESAPLAFHGGIVMHDICSPDQAPPAYRDSVGPRRYLENLRALDRLAADRGLPVVILVDARDQLNPKRMAQVEAGERLLGHVVVARDPARIAAWLAARGHGAYEGSPLALSADDPHPSAAAHELLAGLLAETLERTGILDRVVAGAR